MLSRELIKFGKALFTTEDVSWRNSSSRGAISSRKVGYTGWPLLSEGRLHWMAAPLGRSATLDGRILLSDRSATLDHISRHHISRQTTGHHTSRERDVNFRSLIFPADQRTLIPSSPSSRLSSY